MATIKTEWREAINNALADGTACLVGTVSENDVNYFEKHEGRSY